jgi:hypothetical protein
VRLLESGMYRELQASAVRRGDLLLLFKEPARLGRYVACIVLGLPIWYVIGLLVTFSPEICKELGVTGPVSAGSAILWSYFGLVFGDIGAGFLSQGMRSRRKVVFGFITATLVLIVAFISARNAAPSTIYLLCFALGCAAGYWALFVTIAAEQFGTNLRATVTTTVPNFVRGSVVLVTIVFQSLKSDLGVARSALYVGLGCVALAYLAVWRLRESFGRDLDFVEGDAGQERPLPRRQPLASGK